MSGVSALHRFQEFQVFHAIPQRDITKGSHLQTIRNIYYENNYVFFLEFFGFSPLGHFVAGNFRCLLTSSVSFLFRGWNLPGDPCSSTIHHSAHRFFPSVVATAITSSAHFDNGAHGIFGPPNNMAY